MLTRKRIPIFLSISAIVTGLSVTFSAYVGALAWVSLIPMALCIFKLAEDGTAPRRSYLYGLLFFELYYAVSFHWLVDMYPLDFTGLGNAASVAVIILGLIGFPLLQAVVSALLFPLCAALMRSGGEARGRVMKIASLPCAFASFEFLQTLGAFGVPWSRLSLSQADAVLPIGIASVFGSYAVSFVIVLTNVLLALALRSFNSRSRAQKYALCALAVFLVNLGTGATVFAISKSNERSAETVRVGVVQGNHSSREKWTDSVDEALENQLELARLCAEDGADIIVFSETALPFPLNRVEKSRATLSEFARENGTALLVGALLYEDGKYCNAVYCFESDGTYSETVYVKRHLVPFGEYVPMENFFEKFLPFLTEISVLSDPMTPGEDSELFFLESATVGSLICFDSIYETLPLDSVRDGAQIIAVSTNDSWFSDSSGVYMHNNQSRLRAVELGRCVVRCANTGISSFISSTGTVVSRIEALERGYLCEDVPVLTGRTPYSYIGNVFILFTTAFITAPLIYGAVSNLKNKHENSTRGCTEDED